jgi:hypothetical protein
LNCVVRSLETLKIGNVEKLDARERSN